MYTINFYINNNWIDLRNYLNACDKIPFISRNIDCSLRIEEFNMSISDKIKDIFGSNFEFSEGTPVHIKRENITLFSGFILKSEYNYQNNIFDLRIISDLANLRNKFYSYNTIPNLFSNTTDPYMHQVIDSINSVSIVNPLWAIKRIFEFNGLTLDISELLESTFTYFKWDDVNLSEVKYKQLFMAELLLYFIGNNFYGCKPDALNQPKHVYKIEKGYLADKGDYYDLLLSPNGIDNWQYVHYLNEGDSILVDWLVWLRADNLAQVTLNNRFYNAAIPETTEEIRRETRIRIYAPYGFTTVDQATLDTLNNAPANLPNVYVHKFLNNNMDCENIVSEILSYLGLQLFITDYKSYKIGIGNYFELNPNSPFFGYYSVNNYTISDSEKYDYKVIKNKGEYDEDNYKFNISNESTYDIFSYTGYAKRNVETLTFRAGRKSLNIINNLEIYFRSSTTVNGMYICRLPIKSRETKNQDILLRYLFQNSGGVTSITIELVNDYSMVPSMFLHKLIKECNYETVEVECDAKIELKSVLENFIDIENDTSKITYLKSTEITI